MDLKGLAWIGNIYEKFEAMCLEMEEVICQDTFKYVENKVQTVGASVKKFYSEVMQDLDLESHMDPVKAAAADLSLNPYAHTEMKRKSSAKKDPCESNEKLTDDYKVISGKIKTGAYKRPNARKKGHSGVNYSPPVPGPIGSSSGKVAGLSSFSQRKGSHEVASRTVNVTLSSAGSEGNSRESEDKFCNQVGDTGVPLSGASDNSPLADTKLSNISSKWKQSDSGHYSFSSCLATETSAGGTCTNDEVGPQTDQAIEGNAGFSKSVEEDVMMSHKERLDEFSMDAAKNYDIVDPEAEIIQQFNESILAETCVFVEEDILHLVRQGDGKHKSYKKKLREAFSTKKRSTRKEYEQLAARYKEQDSNEENAERLMSTPCGESSAKVSPAHNCPESEWELL